MKKRLLSIATLVLFGYTGVYAQDWTEMMKAQDKNVHDVQAAFKQWYSQHPVSKEDITESKDKDALNAGPAEENEEDGNYMLFRRWEWIEAARTYPSGNRPNKEALASEYQNFLAARQSERANNVGRIQSSARWSYAGISARPTGGGVGRLSHIRINPSNSSILYACTPSGGLWVSSNGGTTWTTKTDQLTDLATSDIAVDPTNTNVMYLGTGDGDGISGGFTTPSTIGVLKSTNGGTTWSPTSLYYSYQVSGPAQMTVNEILISPANHNYIFAATSSGLYYSPNAGLTWNIVVNGDFKDMAFEPSHPSIMYATTSAAQFYRSTNGGQSFSLVALPGQSGAGRMAVAVTPADSNYVYVLADNSTSFAYFGLWLSTNGGKTFTLQSSSPNLLGFRFNGSDAVGQGWYTLSLAVSPTSATTVLVGGVNIWRSTNAGVSWTLNSNWQAVGGSYVHADIHHLTFLPGSGTTYFAASDGGLSKTTNSGGSTWSDISNGLEISQQYCIGLSASNATLWLTGWQDNGTNLKNGGAWNEALGGDGMNCFIDNTSNSYMYGETYDGGFDMSSNGGGSFSNIAISTSETAAWAAPWLQDPNASQTLYGGYENVWKSTDRGTTWNPISTWGISGVDVIALKVAPSNSQYIYAANYGTMWITTNGGTSWANRTAGLPVGTASISGLAVDNANPARVWATFSGYSATDKVYESDDAGVTWTDISTGLPNMPANCIVYQGGGIDAMYVGTDLGVYYRDTTNTQKTWVSYNSGLPNVSIADLKINTVNNMLMAATYGRGTWQIAEYAPAAAAPVANFTAYPINICALNSVQYTDTSSNLPTSWSWTFAGGTPATSTLQNPTILYNAPGTYQVQLTATNAIGNTSITKNSYITIYPVPTAPTAHLVGGQVTCTPANYAYYQWYNNNVMVPYDTVAQFWPWQPGHYKVVVFDSQGCSVTSNTLVISTLGVNEVSLDDQVKVYPNPTKGSVNIVFSVPEEGEYKMDIVNVLGQTVYTDNISLSGPLTKNIDLTGYGKGVYILSVNGQNSKLVKKIIVY